MTTIRLLHKNLNSFGETYGVSLQIMRRMQKWLKELQSQVNVKKQEKIDITTSSLKKILGRMLNWKSPGPDLVQGFG